MRAWLKDARIGKKLTQLGVANACEISRSYYTHIESGNKTPTVDVAKKIANVLDLQWTNFFKSHCSLKEQIKSA